MSILKIYKNHNLDALLEKYLQVFLSSKINFIGNNEIIICQNRAIQKWISLKICEKTDSFAATKFMPLQEFIYKIIFNPCNKEYLSVFPIYLRNIINSIPEDIFPKTFRKYIAFNKNLLDLACYLIDLFGQYALYRPNILRTWLEGENNYPEFEWQKQIFVKFIEGLNENNLIEHLPWFQLIEAKSYLDFQVIKNRLSKHKIRHISLFSFSQLPPLFLDILFRISKIIDINIYNINPSPELWWMKEDDGCSLLYKLGRSGGRFQAYLQETNYEFYEEENSFPEPSDHNILSQLKRNIYTNTNLPFKINSEDESLFVFSTPSKYQEIEIVKDKILKILIENGEALNFGKIAVMSPDINQYKDIIENVFISEDHFLPYRIADTDNWINNSCINCFFYLISLLRSKFTLNDLLCLLRKKAIQLKFGFSEAQIDMVEKWFRENNLVWGINLEEKNDFSNNDYFDRYSFQDVFNRLIDDFIFYEDNSEISGSACELLGKIISFCDKLFSCSAELSITNNNLSIIEHFRKIAELFFYPESENNLLEPEENKETDEFDKFKGGYQKLQNTLLTLHTELTVLPPGTASDFSLDDLLYFLKKDLDREVENNFKFYTNKINFSSLKPLRSIPFDYVFLIGMTDDIFPRKFNRSNLNLMHKKYFFGDPHPEESDNYLFLETIIQTKKQLTISFISKDSSSMAKPLEELCTYCQTLSGKKSFVIKITEKPYYIEKISTNSLKNFHLNQALQEKEKEKPVFEGILHNLHNNSTIGHNIESLSNLLIKPLPFLLKTYKNTYYKSYNYNIYSIDSLKDNEKLSTELDYYLTETLKKLIKSDKLSYKENRFKPLENVSDSSGSFYFLALEKIKNKYFEYFSLYEEVTKNNIPEKDRHLELPESFTLKMHNYFKAGDSLYCFLNRKRLRINKYKLNTKVILPHLITLGLLGLNNQEEAKIKLITFSEEKEYLLTSELIEITKELFNFYIKDKNIILFDYDFLSSLKIDDLENLNFRQSLLRNSKEILNNFLNQDKSDLTLFLQNYLLSRSYLEKLTEKEIELLETYYFKIILPLKKIIG